MKKLIIPFLFNLSINASTEILSEDELSKLSFNRLQAVISTYRDFVTHSENLEFKYEKFDGEIVLKNNFNDFLINQFQAYANNPGLCFVGGWPTKSPQGNCQAPWKSHLDKEIQSFGQTYNKSNYCPVKGQFRCHTLIFAGACVEMGSSFEGLDQKCRDASRDQIAKLAQEIKTNPAKAKELVHYNNALFGTGGYCKTPGNNKKKENCDQLSLRLKSLMDKNLTGQLGNNGKPENSAQRSLEILNACEQHLIDNSSDDVNERGLLQSLQGGLVSCLGEQSSTMASQDHNFKDMQNIARKFEKRRMLRKVNLKSFEYQLEALLNSEYAFMGENSSAGIPIGDKNKLKDYLGKKIGSLNFEEDYKKVFDQVYEKFSKNVKDGKIKKIDYKTASSSIKTMSADKNSGVNSFCSQIHDEFKSKFKDKKMHGAFEWARPYSDEEEAFINEKKSQLNQRLTQNFQQSHSGFLLGTEHYKENVFDPSFDHTKECIQNKGVKVINPNISESDYKKSLKQAQETILASFGDLNKKEAPITAKKIAGRGGAHLAELAAESRADDLIKDYLKENRMLLVDTLMSAKDEEKVDMSKYLCAKVGEIYDRDETMQVVSWVGAGVSVIGGVACAFPLTAPIGCPVMWGGSAVAGLSGSSKMYEATVLSTAADRNQIISNKDASEYNELSLSASGQFKDGALEFGGAALGAGASGIVKGARAISSLAKSSKTVAVYDDGLGVADEMADTIYFRDPSSGKVTARKIHPKAKVNGQLSDPQRIAGIKKDFPHLTKPQIDSVMKAHKDIVCAVGTCTKAQLVAKMDIMKKAGINHKDYREVVRLGYAGNPNPSLAQVADDGFWSLRVPNQSFGKPIVMAADHPNAAVVNTLQDLAPTSSGKFVRLNVDRVMPDGSIKTKTVQGYFRGNSEGRLLQFESGSEGMFAIDINDANLIIRNIEVPQSRVVNGVMQADDYRPIFETNPARVFSRAQGRQVKVEVIDEDGDTFDLVGEVVKHQGKLQLKAANKYSPGQYIYTPIDDLNGVQKISAQSTKGSWQGASEHPRALKENFSVGSKVKIEYTKKSPYGEASAAKAEGEYLGVVTHNNADAIAVRGAKGEISYIPLDRGTAVTSTDEAAVIFNGGKLVD